MQKNVITIEHDKTAHDAACLISEKDISFLVILDDDKLVGVLTQTDLTEFLRNKLLVDQTVKNIQKSS